jgi:uncharacterized protein (DUF362 family)
MEKHTVSLVKYSQPLESVRQAVDMAGGLGRIKPGDKVFIKPNIVFWTDKVAFPKWGVITTSRVMQDMVALLAGHGVTGHHHRRRRGAGPGQGPRHPAARL